ncbi:MAG: hypothetical protein CL483_03235 [Acidobacteria bacterium]|nr:hypothetical protein [Acidobacteriota bacterium]
MFLVSRSAFVLTAYAAALSLLALSAPARAQSPTLATRSASTVTGSDIVVMPFENLSGRPDDAWIGAGIAETVTIALGAHGVTLLPDTDDNDTRRTVAEQLGAAKSLKAGHLITGTYQRIGDLIRVTTRLVDVQSEVAVRTGQVDGHINHLFDTQDRVAETLSQWLDSALRSDRPKPTPSSVVPPSMGPVSGALRLEEAPAERGNPAGRMAGLSAVSRGRPTTTIGRTDAPPNIDGRLDDAVWKTATHLTEFIQITPLEGVPGTEESEVWLAYDSNHIYVAFYAHYTNTGDMRVNRADRDEIRGDDRFSVLFDPFLDQQRAYQFEVNGFGVQADSIVNADGSSGVSSSSVRPQQTGGVRRVGGGRGSGLSGSGQFGIRGDASWNTLFTTAGQLVDDGWTAEMQIPFKSLRYPGGGSGTWGFQITRIIRDISEAQTWSPISRGVQGQLTQFGRLEGLSGLSTSRNLEFLPEITGIRFGSLDTANGQFNDQSPDGDAGLSVKYGVTPNLTADITFNPDFSQIESDRPQIETNQRFDLFFPEQRPFFLEGQEIFGTPTTTNLLNTRTIIDPRFGGKLTGKVGRTTIGILAADDEAGGLLGAPLDSQLGRTAQTFVGRARYDLYSESYLGAIATARQFGDDFNRVAGVDGRFRLGRTHRLSFMAVGSSTQETEGGELAGAVLEADYTRQGRNLGYGASYSSVGPEFRTATGFLPRLDYRQALGNISYRFWPESALITWGPTVEYLRLYDHEGILQDEQLQARASFSFQNNISLNGTVSQDLERFNEIDFRKTGYGFFGIWSQRLVSILGGMNWGDGVLFSDNPFLGRSVTGNFQISARPTSRLRAELVGIFSQFVDPANDSEIFDVKIFRTRATYQFTSRMLMRHILEYNTASLTLGNNLLLTYRINAGTVAFLGYDDRFQSGSLIDSLLFDTRQLQRTNRAVFAKVSYLFRY